MTEKEIKKIINKLSRYFKSFIKANSKYPTLDDLTEAFDISKTKLRYKGNRKYSIWDRLKKNHKKELSIAVAIADENKDKILKIKLEKVIIKFVLVNSVFPSRRKILELAKISNHSFLTFLERQPSFISSIKKHNEIKDHLISNKVQGVATRRLQIEKVVLKVLNKNNAVPTLMNMEEENISRPMIRSAFGSIFKLIEHTEKKFPLEYSVAKTRKDKFEKDRKEKKLEMAKVYYDLAIKLERYPSGKDLSRVGLSSSAIYKYFFGIAGMKDFVIALYSKHKLKKVHDIDDLVNDLRLLKTRKNIKKFNRFVVSSIGTGSLDKDFLKSIYNYCEKNKARLLLVPTEVKFDQIDSDILGEYVKGNLDIVFEEVKLCSNLHINSVRINEKVTNPTAGISRYQKDNSSFVYASPKQTITSVAVKKKGHPRYLMSPGSITEENYMNDPLFKKKRRLMAENDHLEGLMIFEIEGEDRWYMRQSQKNLKDSSFPDMGVRYLKNGKYKIDSPEAFVMGDLHSSEKHEDCFQTWLNIIKGLNIKSTIMHDIFDAKSINPHEKNQLTKSLSLTVEKDDLLSNELITLVSDLNRVSAVCDKTYIVDSNHDDMLQRAFDSGLVWRNPRNAILGSLLQPYSIIHNLKDDYSEKEILSLLSDALKMPSDVVKKYIPAISNGKGILEYACELYGLDAKKNKVDFLNLDSSLIIGGFELGDHGHKGSNGAKGSPVSAASSFTKRISGHTHTEYQFNYVISVGHTSNDPRYARGGASSWSRASSIVYSSGEVQSIRYINGRVRSTKDAFLPKEISYKDKDTVKEKKKKVA